MRFRCVTAGKMLTRTSTTYLWNWIFSVFVIISKCHSYIKLNISTDHIRDAEHDLETPVQINNRASLRKCTDPNTVKLKHVEMDSQNKVHYLGYKNSYNFCSNSLVKPKANYRATVSWLNYTDSMEQSPSSQANSRFLYGIKRFSSLFLITMIPVLPSLPIPKIPH
jgi:hypothetical protein